MFGSRGIVIPVEYLRKGEDCFSWDEGGVWTSGSDRRDRRGREFTCCSMMALGDGSIRGMQMMNQACGAVVCGYYLLFNK